MKIRFKTGSLAGKAYQVKDGVVLVGRSHVCTVRIPGKEFPSVSKQHLLLMLTPEGMSLTNNSSHSDTTFVDGLPIPPGHKTFISDGSVVRIGRQGADMEFKVEGDEGMTSSGLEVETGGGRATGTVGAVTAQATRGSMTKITSGGTVGTVMPGFQPTGLPTAGTRLPENFHQKPFKTFANQGTVTVHEQGAQTNHGDDEKTRNPDGTIPVDPEDIKILIQEAIRRRKAKSMMRFGLVIGILCLAAMTYYLMRPRPESILTWPKDANGRFACYTQSLVVPAATKEEKDGFSITVPNDSRMSVSVSSNEVGITTRILSYVGVARDVPFFVEAHCFRDVASVNKTSKSRFKAYMRSLEEAGSWNVLSTRPLAFLGMNNGLPYFEAKYLRTIQSKTAAEQRFGHLMFVVYGDLTIVVTREIPAIEQWRGSALLARELLFSVKGPVLDVRWEGRPDFRDSPVAVLLSEADGYVSLKTPQLWKEVEFLLQSAMIKAAIEKTDSSGVRDRLRKLREDERKEYNRLFGVWKRFDDLGDKARCDATITEARKVFTESDRRNWLLLKGVWR